MGGEGAGLVDPGDRQPLVEARGHRQDSRPPCASLAAGPRFSRRSSSPVSLGGCFEPPVAERMLLEFLSDGAARATLMIDLGRAGGLRVAGRAQADRDRRARAPRRHRPLARPLAGLTAGDDGPSFRRTAGPCASSAAGPSSTIRRASPPCSLRIRSTLRTRGTATADARDRAERREPRDAQGARARAARSRGMERRLLALRGPGLRPRASSRGQSGKKKKLLAKGVRGEGGRRARSRPEAARSSRPRRRRSPRRWATASPSFWGVRGRWPRGFSLDERVRKVFHPLSAQLIVTLPVAARRSRASTRRAPRSRRAKRSSPTPFRSGAFSRRSTLSKPAGWSTGPARAMLDHLRGNPDAEMDIADSWKGQCVQESATPPGPTDVADPLLELLRPEGAYRLVWHIPNPTDR